MDCSQERTANEVPIEIDEKHKVTDFCRHSAARMRAMHRTTNARRASAYRIIR